MKLELISEFGNPEKKSLLISLPYQFMKNIAVDENGCVDTLTLLGVLNEAYEAEQRLLTLDEHIELMDLIFNDSRAVDEKEIKRKK